MRKAEIIYGSNLKTKDSYITNEIKNIIDGGGKVLYIVPEQYAFSADKKILFELGERYSHLTQTINFKRMALLVNENLNPNKKNYITEEIKNLILYKIYCDNVSEFKALTKRGNSPDTVLIFKDILTELKTNLITPDELEKVISQLPDGTFLHSKLCDLKLISEIYEKYIEENYRDFEDGFLRLSENIEKHGLYKDYHVFIDNFTHFSKSENLVLKALFKNAKSVYVSLLGDDFNSQEEGDLFYLTASTLKEIQKIAEETDYSVTFKKCDAPEKNHLKEIFVGNVTEKSENIVVTEAKNPTDEIRFVVSQIKSLISKGEKYSDMAVFTGDITIYEDIINAQFKMSDIPFFDDRKVPLLKNPASQLIMGAYEAFVSGFKAEEVLTFLKSMLLVSEDSKSVMLFEKIAATFRFEKDILKDREKWETALDTALLGNKYLKAEKKALNSVYEKFILPVVTAFSPLKKKNTGDEYLECFSDFIKLSGLEIKLRKRAEKMADSETARDLVNAYNTFLGAIKNISLIHGDIPLSKEDYLALLKQSAGVYKTGQLPNRIDCVTVSDLERGRSENKKYVFIVGLNDGVCPKTNETTGFLSDNDRRLIESVTGTELPTAIWKNNSSLLSFYRACNLADVTLYVSKSNFQDNCEPLSPSFLWGNFTEKNEVSVFDSLYVNINEASRTAISAGEKESEFYKYVSEKREELFSEIDQMEKENYFSSYKHVSKKLLDSKFSKKLNTSVSRLETYRKCGYSYFLKYLLKVDEPETATYDFAKTGTLVHNIIDSFSKKASREGMDWETITEEYIDTSLKGAVYKEILENFPKINMFNPRTKYLSGRLTRTAKTAILYIKEHFKRGEFVPLGYEIPIDENGVKPVSIALSDGTIVEIYGRVDRADGFFDTKSNKLFVRIIDYKSSQKSIDFALVKEGIQLQLLTYLNSLIKSGAQYFDFAGEILPGAALYMAYDHSMTRFEEKPEEEEIKKAITKKFMMEGIILNDDDVITAMDKELQGDGKVSTDVVNVVDGRTGKISLKNLLYREQFEVLLCDCENLIKETGEKIIQGEFFIKPYRFGTKTACEWCVYKSICGFDNTVNSYKTVSKLTKDEYFEKGSL